MDGTRAPQRTTRGSSPGSLACLDWAEGGPCCVYAEFSGERGNRGGKASRGLAAAITAEEAGYDEDELRPIHTRSPVFVCLHCTNTEAGLLADAISQNKTLQTFHFHARGINMDDGTGT